MKKKRNFLISTILILLALTFTILVKVVDVKQVGVNGTSIGVWALNQFVFKTTGVNMIWYHITDWLGLVPIFMAMVYSLLGIVQLIKRKSLFKVDKEIMILGLFYIIVISIYIFFEKVIVNYRPILMNGFLEASYPSSHTLMTICLCGSSIIVITVIGRLISGVHWFTDILGGIFIGVALLMTLYSLVDAIRNN